MSERMISYEDLSYATTHELWEMLASLGIMYFNVEESEKENLETHEKITIPKIVPRTDYENMKSDVLVGIQKLNRKQRRNFYETWNKKFEKRKNSQEVKDNG